jgi:NAD(P)-dependent dehydrogenase (short-subunit alcohol dehydrogenase family)
MSAWISLCEQFQHTLLRLMLITFRRCNAGIMFKPPSLSKDGYEATFATNHLAHAMIIKQLLPTLSKTAETPNADVRLINLTSEGWAGHPKEGVNFSTLQTTQNGLFGKLTRYGQVKITNMTA